MQSLEASIQQRPLVILAGWLGCKSQHLNHYARFYESLGIQVLIEIATPTQIFLAATQKYSDKIHHNGSMDNTIQHLARAIIQAANDLNPSFIIFHVFSNGGGFLWEAIRFQLLHRKNAWTAAARSKIHGIIFDSAPANYSDDESLISNVLDYCEDQDEKTKIQQYLERMTEDQLRKSKERSQEYWFGMRNCSFPIPHLYVCSKDDKLTPYRHLHELIQHRERLFGKDMIRSLVFDSSPHCQHFRRHEEDYKSAIVRFVNYIENNKHKFAQGNLVLRSRL
jgi:hypothetical protein